MDSKNYYEHGANLSLNSVSEPIALELRQNSGDVYLHAQLFTGSMYIGAAICMWFLRAWKVKELEQIAIEKGESIETINVVNEPKDSSTNVKVDVLKPNTIKRLCSWMRV